MNDNPETDLFPGDQEPAGDGGWESELAEHMAAFGKAYLEIGLRPSPLFERLMGKQ